MGVWLGRNPNPPKNRNNRNNRKNKMSKLSKMLCWFGIHDWSYVYVISKESPIRGEIHMEKICVRCDAVKSELKTAIRKAKTNLEKSKIAKERYENYLDEEGIDARILK